MFAISLSVAVSSLAVAVPAVAATNQSKVTAQKSVLDAPAVKEIGRVQRAIAQGRYDQAVRFASQLLEAKQSGALNARDRVMVRLLRAEAYRNAGFFHRATEDLEAIAGLEPDLAGDPILVLTQIQLGTMRALSGSPDTARGLLQDAREAARRGKHDELELRALNELGAVALSQDQLDQAEEIYKIAGLQAKALNDTEMQAVTALNSARVAFKRGDSEVAEARVATATAALAEQPDSAQKAMATISAARLLMRIESQLQQSEPNRTAQIYELLRAGQQLAGGIADVRAESYAIGYTAELYERAGRFDEARHLTQTALFKAQQADAKEILYLWQWQDARIHRKQGDSETALALYREAVKTLNDIRPDLSQIGSGVYSFRDSVAPLLLEMADLLLQNAKDEQAPELIQANLIEARETVELMKAAELEDYFQDDCVARLQSRAKSVDRVDARTAAIYPIPLADRVELLLSLPDGMARITAEVSGPDLEREVNTFRRYLEKRTTRQYLRSARKIYNWLIRPAEETLKAHAVDTLVAIPSGALGTIPIAALHDGEQHLIERYAVAVTPGLTLIDPQPIGERSGGNLMLNGLTESREGFPPLPFVADELAQISEMVGGQLFRDDKFRMGVIQTELASRSYPVIHMATHAKFEADAGKSFLLTYDGRMTLDQLEDFMQLSRFRDEPIELLTLSACQTAVGDQRAALGLAGVAIKAGARSALASLWFVNDESTSQLVSKFYGNLGTAGFTKAKALQQAQISLLKDRRYRHPGYWAPFLLIGNWL